MPTLEEMMLLAEDYALNQSYCWFRITFTNMDQEMTAVTPMYTCWFEDITGTTKIERGKRLKPTLYQLLTSLNLL